MVFLGTFWLENAYNKKSLLAAKDEVTTFFSTFENNKKGQLEKYVVTGIENRIEQVNTLLSVIGKVPSVSSYFSPTEQNRQTGTWVSASALLLSNHSFRFIQNTNDGKLSSSLMVGHDAFLPATREDIKNNIAIIAAEEKGSSKTFIGVPLILEEVHGVAIGDLSNEILGTLPRVYVLFSKESLLAFPEKIQGVNPQKDAPYLVVPFMEKHSINIAEFLTSISQARAYVLDPLYIESSSQVTSSGEPSTLSEQEHIAYLQLLFMIWEAADLFQLQIFGDPLSSQSLPFGLCVFPPDSSVGKALSFDKIFPKRISFADASHFLEYAPKDPHDKVASAAAIIPNFVDGELYLGNTVQLAADGRVGYLTVGFPIEEILRDIATSFSQTACVVTEGKVAVILTPDGRLHSSVDFAVPMLSALTKTPTGFVEWKGRQYYYMYLHPLAGVDLDIFFLNEPKIEFALINQLDTKLESLLSQMSSNRRMIILGGIFFLLLGLFPLTKKMTKSIIALADAALKIKEGKWKEVNIPEVNFGKNNEIQKLCLSFKDMARGLEEKEKVKSILNKIVSPDIAREILQKEVHLGGEEKSITLFFADVRHFTHITQHMPPHEVIELVNECMTKIAYVIDNHHGVIDKYIGDGVMVLFGAPIAREDSALQAIQSALECRAKLDEWNKERKALQKMSVEIGIGIHTGKVILGNMGAESRLNYTAIGSNVNLASRLCSAAKGREILISAETAQEAHVAEQFVIESRGKMELKGFDEPKQVYSVIGYTK